jgi:hypothetical protein
MNSRERTLALALGGIAALYAGRWLVMDVILGPISRQQARLEVLEDDLAQKQLQLTSQKVAADALKKWKEASLTSESQSSVVYRGYLLDLLKKAGIKNPNIQAQPIREARGAYQTLPFTIDAQCDLSQLAKLLYEFQRTDLLHGIRTIDVRPQITNDKIEHLVAKVEVEVLAFADAPPRDKLEPGDKPDERKFDEFKFFVEKNFFQPTNVVDRGRAVVSAARDDRGQVRFTGTIRADGVEAFVFYNGSTSKLLYLTQNQTLEIPGMSAKVLGYDSEASEIILQVADKVGVVRAGQTLSTWKESAKRSAAMNLASQPTL